MTMGEATRKDELLAAIQSGDEQQCIRLLKGLDETARRALHPSVAKAVEEIRSAHEMFRSDQNIAQRLCCAGTPPSAPAASRPGSRPIGPRTLEIVRV